MKAKISRLDISHEFLFAQPAFQLAQNAPNVLKIFFETISPRYQIPAEHMSVAPSNVLSDLVIRLGLFQNSATLELRPQKLVLICPNVRDKESVQVIKDIISLVHEARQKALPGVAGGDSRFQLFVWLIIEGGEKAAREVLAKGAIPASAIDPRALAAEQVDYNIKVKILNKTEKWDILVMSEPSAVPETQLFVMIDTWFRGGSKFSALNEQVQFVENILPKIFATLGLELDT